MSTLNVAKLVASQVAATGGVFVDAADIFRPSNKVSGKAVFTTPGTFSFVVPEGVIKISALAVGAGAGGSYQWSQNGGSGGALAWADNIEVTAGDTISITVPADTPQLQDGGAASVGSFFSAGGGIGTGGNGRAGGAPISGTVKAQGGSGGSTYISSAGGGGGAGGYTGNGGNGYYGNNGTPPYNGSGGAAAGGGGYGSSTYGFGGGGGVGIEGEGTSGTWGSLPSQTTSPENNGNSHYTDLRYAGAAGSNGENGAPNSNGSITSNKGRTHYHGAGGNYGGGGGGGGTSNNNNSNFCRGAQGAVRIVWSTDPNFSIAS